MLVGQAGSQRGPSEAQAPVRRGHQPTGGTCRWRVNELRTCRLVRGRKLLTCPFILSTVGNTGDCDAKSSQRWLAKFADSPCSRAWQLAPKRRHALLVLHQRDPTVLQRWAAGVASHRPPARLRHVPAFATPRQRRRHWWASSIVQGGTRPSRPWQRWPTSSGDWDTRTQQASWKGASPVGAGSGGRLSAPSAVAAADAAAGLPGAKVAPGEQVSCGLRRGAGLG